MLLGRGADVFGYDQLQRLNSATVQGLNAGESVAQSFAYDRYGNRTSSGFTYTAGTSGVKPDELMAWTAVYDDVATSGNGRTNSLPTMVQTASGPLPTGATYDDLGRLSSVWAIPGDSSKQTSWVYDPASRMTSETVGGATTRFLLDSEGLRFKRYNDGGAVTYTVYGFNREPLITFDKITGGVNSLMATGGSTKNSSSKTTKVATQSLVDPGTLSAQIMTPATDITLGIGQTLLFKGAVTGATTKYWDFGDGSTATYSLAGTNHAFSAGGSYVVALVAKNSAGQTAMDYRTITVPAKPVVTFSASPASIIEGQSSTLSWTVYGGSGTTVSISGVGSGLASSGSTTISPGATNTYTLTATNANGSTVVPVTVTVTNKPSIQSFSASPTRIGSGSSATLVWTVSGATSCSISGVGSVATSGSTSIAPGSTTTYVLSATNAAGTSSASCQVQVDSAPPVISSFTASPTQIAQGEVSLLTWSVSNAATVSISGLGTMAAGSTQISVTPSVTQTFTLTASNTKGSSTATATVTVSGIALTWRTTFVYGFGQLLSEERPGGTIYQQGDQVGSPNILTDASGAVVGRSKNLPFGERFGKFGQVSARRYTNHEDQPGSAVYMQARSYLPAYGKFAQPDPAYDQAKLDPESWNLFSYVTNNPVMAGGYGV